MIIPPVKKMRYWHSWYAWHPVKVAGYYMWLETVERRWINETWCYFSDVLDDLGVDQ